MDVCGGIQDAEGGPDEAPLMSVSDLPEGTTSEKLKALFEAEFQWLLRDNPEFATQSGFHQYDGRLQDLKPQSFDDRIAHNDEVKAALAKLELEGASGPEGPSDAERLYAELLLEAVDSENRGIALGCHLAPITSIGVGGVHENFFELLEWMRFDEDDDFKVYINRLMAFPKQVEGYMDLLAYGACRMGHPASKSMMRKVPDRLKSLLDGNFDELREPLQGKTVSPEVAEAVDQAITNCFRHGIARLQDFLNEFYSSRLRESPGIKAVRQGEEIYAESLRFHTTTRKTAQEIHDLGLQEVARIEGRFQAEVLDAAGFKGTFREFADSLKADPKQVFDSEEALVDGYKALIDKISAVMPRYFSKLHKMPLEVTVKRSGPAAYYYAGTPDGKRPGRFYVNTTGFRPKYEMTALALHEGVPGHHLQAARALETEGLPDFLRYVEDRRYEFGAARRPLYTGYIEGWALYCEHLGEEMGMYATPYELFGRLSMEMLRAVRLVVDTGIHAFGWTVEKAAEYMEEKTGMASEECLEECHRYAAWPGQACAYKVGELAIKEVRAKCEALLGDKFDLPAFHELLVGHGPVPLDVLSRRCDEWAKARVAT